MRSEKKQIILITFATLLLLSTHGLALDFPLPDTGQTKCYDDDLWTIPCPQSGEPFFGQDGNYNITSKSYTKIDLNGDDLPEEVNAPSHVPPVAYHSIRASLYLFQPCGWHGHPPEYAPRYWSRRVEKMPCCYSAANAIGICKQHG